MAYEFEHLCGAIIDPVEAAAFQAAQPIQAYSSLPRESGAGQKRFLWEYERQVLGGDFHELQTTGTCVSKAIQRAIVCLGCTRIALQGMAEAPPLTPASEAIFALGRVEIGGGRLGRYNPQTGRGDGLVVTWGLRAVMKYGVLPRGVYGSIDLTKPNDQLAEQWGQPGVGLPDELEPIARQMPVKDAVPIGSTVPGVQPSGNDPWTDAINGLYNGEPIFGGSNHVPAFSRGQYVPRDRNGYAALSGGGGHSTIFTGYDDTGADGANEPWIFYNNASWPEVEGPNPLNAPTRGGKIPKSLFLQMMKEGEWYALSDITGMPNQAAMFDMM